MSNDTGDGDGHTTIRVSHDTKARLQQHAPDGGSWDWKLRCIADELAAGGDDGEDIESYISAEDLDGLRDDLLAELPRRVADEVEHRLR